MIKRELMAELELGGCYAVLAGDAVSIADEFMAWTNVGEVGGFNLSRIVMPETFSASIGIVTP